MPIMDRPDIATFVRDEIRTPRLTLRRPVAGDVDAIARLAADYAIASMTTRMPHPYGLSDARQFVDLAGRQDRSRERAFAIEHPDHGLIGVIGFHGAPLEMGYWIGRPFWGQGCASEAACAALQWAGGDWGRRRVLAGHFVDNPGSARVLIKAGFLYTGEVQNRHSRARGVVVPTRMMVWLA